MTDSYILTPSGTHLDGFAEVGETVSFFPVLMHSCANRKAYGGLIRWKLVFNGAETLSEGEFDSSRYSGGVVFRADRPGYYKAVFEAFRNGQSVAEARIGVLARPEVLRPTLPVPEDFDAFWEKQLAELRNVPVAPQLTPLDASGTVAAFDLQAPCAGDRPVSGIFMRPVNAQRGKHPAILLPHGAGVRSAGSTRFAAWAANGFLALDLNAHGIKNGLDPQEYEAINQKLGNYPVRGFETGDPEKTYMRNLFLRVVRALEVLTSMPEWDGRNLWICGGSQGAWQSLAGGALMKQVSGIAVWIPAGCDLASGGWPFNSLTGKKELPPELLRTLPYFDGCSFCSRIGEIPVSFALGLADEVCRADGVMAAYNSLKTGTRELSLHYQMGHEFSASVMASADRFVRSHLRK